MEYDLHVHSMYSFDCSMEPARIVKTAVRRGLAGVAITDHDSCEGVAEAEEAAPEGFLVIPGFEKSTKAGDILGLFVREMPDSKDALEVVQAIHEQGGVAILPHPFAYRPSVDDDLIRAVDAVEVFNARYPVATFPGIEFRQEHVEAFARANDVHMVASSDSHVYGAIGRARTVIPACTLEEVKEALLRGNTVPVAGALPFLVRAEDAVGRFFRVLLGDSMAAGPRPPVEGGEVR